MARGSSPVGVIVTAGAVALVGWFVWARFPKVSSAIKMAVADIGGRTPDWIAKQDAAAQTSAPIAPAPPTVLGGSPENPAGRVPISELALGPICRDFPAACDFLSEGPKT